MKAIEARKILISYTPDLNWSQSIKDTWNTAIKEIETLEELSEKQEPMRAYTEFNDDFNCPSCGENTEAYDVTILKFCPECGQKLKWN